MGTRQAVSNLPWISLAVILAACGSGTEPEQAEDSAKEGGYVETLGRAYHGGFAERTRGDMQAIATALGQAMTDAGGYPAASDMDALASRLEPTYVRGMPRVDAWGAPFRYESTGAGFTLTSYGKDGAPGGGDDLVMTEAGFR